MSNMMELFVKEENEPPLPQAQREVRRGDVALVFRQEEETSWTSVLYIRQHLVDVQQKLDDFFQDGRKKRLYIQGPPGCGKTCFCSLWARLLSVRDEKRVLIIQFRPKESCLIWFREADGSLWRKKEFVDSEDLRASVKQVLKKKDPFDLCIHDGVIDKLAVCTSMISTLNTAVANHRIRKVIHVTSLAFSLSTGGQNLDSMTGNISEMALDSWTEEDYQEALQCQKFRDELTKNGTNSFENDLNITVELVDSEDDNDSEEPVDERKESSDDMDVDGTAATVTDDASRFMEILRAKYYYAGGSARFMFMYQIQEVKKRLDKRLKNVEDKNWEFFARSSVSSGTSSSVNTLMQQFAEHCTPISKYVLFWAYDKCKTKLVKSVRAAAEAVNNPSLKGWAILLEQIDLIRLSLESTNANPSFITNNMGLSFRPRAAIDFDGKTVQTNGTIGNEGTVIWCLKWNQGCFDTAFFQNSTLVTMQFTVSEEHTFKPKYIRWLRNALSEKGVVVDNFIHVGVADVNNFQFYIDTAGTGRPDNSNEPEFTIRAYHSRRLVKQVARQNVAFQTSLSPALTTVDMWPLAATKKRARQK